MIDDSFSTRRKTGKLHLAAFRMRQAPPHYA